MKKNNSTQISNIEKINLLLKRFINRNASKAEINFPKIQLKESDELGYLPALLKKIKSSVALESEEELTPNPMIKSNIRKRMMSRAEMQQDGSKASLLDFFQIRIPVYQAAIAVFAVIVLFLAINLPQSKNNPSAIAFGQTGQVERSIVDSLRIMQNLQLMENQKVGRSMQEDTLLIRFIKSSVNLF